MKIVLCLRDEAFNEKTEQRVLQIGEEREEWMDITICSSIESVYFLMEEDVNLQELLILDTEIFGEDGVKVAAKLRRMGYENELIFLTNDSSKVFDSFYAEPLNYILADEINGIRFEAAFARACEKVRRKQEEMISISCAGEIKNINLRDIYSFQSDGRMIEVHFGKGKSFRFYSTMGRVSEMLFGKGFLRIHRGVVIAIPKIASISRTEATLTNGECFPVSKTYYLANKEFFEKKTAKIL